MAEAATVQTKALDVDLFNAEPPNVDTARELTSLPFERFTRAKAERFIGIVTVGSEFEISQESGPQMSLLEALRKGAQGNAEALRLMHMNVLSDTIERAIKKGHLRKVTQQIGVDGDTVQHGHTGRSIQANSLRYASKNPKMLLRTKAETRNLFRITDAQSQGLLRDHYAVVPSRPEDNMSETELHDAGFFTDTMSISFQATTENANDSTDNAPSELVTENAFVAGKRHRLAPRHDAELVRRLGERLGIDVGEQTALESLDRPWLVPKSMMPNGLIDLVRMADEIMGTFFGEDRPAEDYLEYLKKCEERERAFEPIAKEIAAQLIAEVNQLQTPLDATQRLHELSEAKLVQQALHDPEIDLNVLGTEAAYYVSAARYYYERGEYDKVDEFMDKAIETADTSSCPGAGTSRGNQNVKTDGTGGAKSEEDGDCEFTSKECPLCHKKNVHTTVKKLPSGKKYIKGSCGCRKIA